MRELFIRTEELFSGKYPGYQACDVGFHDFAHTCQVTVAVARIVDGNLRRGRRPNIHAEDYDLVIASALLHDIGYLKETGDRAGTGAKFTSIHVTRGSEFAGKFLKEFEIGRSNVEFIQRLILWTGINVDYETLACFGDIERRLGYILGTGDLLGQMAADGYPQRLDALHAEFQEAARVAIGKGGGSYYAFETAADLRKNTRAFYVHYVMQVLENSYRGIFHDLEYHFPNRQNLYMRRIEENLDAIEAHVAAT